MKDPNKVETTGACVLLKPEELDRVERRIDELSKNLSAVAKERNGLLVSLQQERTVVSILRGTIAALHGDLDRLSKRTAVVEQQRDTLREDRNTLIKDLEKANRERANLRGLFDSFANDYESIESARNAIEAFCQKRWPNDSVTVTCKRVPAGEKAGHVDLPIDPIKNAGIYVVVAQ